MDPKVIVALVVLVVGLIITTGVVASAVTSGDKAKDEMMVSNYKPPPPPSPIPLPPPPPSSPGPSPPPPAAPVTRRALGVSSEFKITAEEKRRILLDRSGKTTLFKKR